MHSMQWYACRERSESVWNYEEDTVSNDDENDGFRRAHESRRLLARRAARDSLQYLDCDKSDVM